MKRSLLPAIPTLCGTVLLALPTALAQVTIVNWGDNSQSIITLTQANPGTGSTLNSSAVLAGDFVNPNQGTGGYYAGSADPVDVNPLFLGARNNTSGGSVVNQLNAAGSSLDSIRTAFPVSSTGQALYFWNQSMVWNAATSTTTGWTEGKDYGFLNGLNAGNVTLTSLSARVGVNTSTNFTATFRFALLKQGVYYLSEGFNVTTSGGGGTVITRSDADLSSLTWAAFSPTTSLAAAASGYATLGDYEGIQGVGVWVQGTTGATGGNTFAVSDFTVTAVPEPSAYALVFAGGLIALVVGRLRTRTRA